ncbi:MAG: hypothetical protein R3190_14550, partial [Thermoanaerobaculia bacterium]|nr:hypothetical protein [Thermoanaerobaculia bacterium]
MDSLATVAEREAAPWAAYAGAEAPARRRRVDAGGLGISVAEWGGEDDPVLLLAHGGSDFARTFDGF